MALRSQTVRKWTEKLAEGTGEEKKEMDRKAIARETLEIMKRGWYETEGQRVETGELQARSVRESFLLTPVQGEELLAAYEKAFAREAGKLTGEVRTWNCSTVDAIRKLSSEGKKSIGVLNFASAKNPGGGFLNGAMAQEESLAASSSLYETLIAHEKYYEGNRACGTMMYTDHAIYSPEVVFFRDGSFRLQKEPVTASVLTLPAVNMGQVMQKGEDVERAETVMKRRMKLALSIFAGQKCKSLILGAYGCGVFRNDPVKIATWWKELLETYFSEAFETVVFAVLDHSSAQVCIKAFRQVFGKEKNLCQ